MVTPKIIPGAGRKKIPERVKEVMAFDPRLLEVGNDEALRAEYHAATKDKRDKMLAVVSCVYGSRVLAEKLGISERSVCYARQKHTDLVGAGLLARNLSIAQLSERKMLELVAAIDVDKLEDKEKARSAKYLADVAAAQYERMSEVRGRDEGEEETEELIYKIKRRRMVKREVGVGDIGNAIDITGDVDKGGGGE